MVFDILYQEFDVMKNGYYKDNYGEFWYLNNELHREDGPAVIYVDGTQVWHLNGKMHREDGPAIIYADGAQEWFINGKLHREDGPAVIYPDGYQVWWVNGRIHREDGPAVIRADGFQEWWVNGEPITTEVNKWFNDYNLTYDTLTDEEKLYLIFYIRSLM
jgi:hypothetical protein